MDGVDMDVVGGGGFSLEKQLGGAGAGASGLRPSGVTPTPPGLAPPSASTLAGIAASSSLFGGGLEARKQALGQQGYNPFGMGLLDGIGGGGAQAQQQGQGEEALASKNPFLAGNGFGSFAPWAGPGEAEASAYGQTGHHHGGAGAGGSR
jgi:hypothetical protein